MKLTSHPSPSAITRTVWLALGLFFCSLTARVLLWEVRWLADITADHLLTLGALVGAIASGVFFWHMLRALKLLTALGLGIAFTAATVYCLIGSAGRGDEVTFSKNAGARQVNADRRRAERDQAEAKKRYDAALRAEEDECASGAGPKCTAKRDTTKLRRSDLEVAEILLRQQAPEQRENGKLKRAAELIAFFGRRDEAEAERGLALVWPFIPPLVCELLTIVFLHLGFGVSKVSAVQPETVSRSPPAAPEPPPIDRKPRKLRKLRKPKTALGAMRKPSATVVNGPWPGASMTEGTALAFVRERVGAGDAFPSQDAIAARCGVTKGCVSKWLKRWEASGVIARSRDGRRKVIGAASMAKRA